MMKWMTPLILLAAIGGAHLQCFTQNPDSKTATQSVDVSSITDFGVDLYKQLNPAHSSKNFFFSPYSIWNALILAYIGSEGETKDQLEAALRLSDKTSTMIFWKTLESKYKLQQQDNVFTFNVANRAYIDRTLNLRPCTKNILHEELRVVNFKDTIGSAEEINNFVSNTTKGRISSIVTPKILRNTVMALVNAVFFKGIWNFPFDPQNTRQEDFFITPQDSTPLAMMFLNTSLRYSESRQLGARVLELPYSRLEASMFLLLPSPDKPAETRFENMVNNLNGATLRDAIHQIHLNILEVEVLLPKFKFDIELREELKMSLMKMGIVDLFDERVANLTAFDPSGNLAVTETIHKSFVEVNEEGTEAAAVTGFFIDKIFSEPQFIRFHCNEPFIFLIHDNRNNNILFMGAIKNPRTLEA